MKIFMISDTHFGVRSNSEMDKWLSMMEDTFYKFVIPTLKREATEGDILIHLGDLFDNRTSIPIIVLNKVERILKDVSDILPIHILVGNHDLWNKGSNDVNSVRLFGYINENIRVYEETYSFDFFGKRIVLMPWVEKRTDMINEINHNKGDYLFCHSDLNGCKMHLSSVANRNPDKIDVSEFSGYLSAFSGHIHIRQCNSNFTFIGSLWQMDRNDIGDEKGITSLDVVSGKTSFYPNFVSPQFRRISILSESDIDSIDSLRGSSDYIDISISNSLIVSNRKLRRKLELSLESGNFSSVEYIDDIIDVQNSPESDIESVENTDGDKITVQLDYEKLIRAYILAQKYEAPKIGVGVLSEFDDIIGIYNQNYTQG